jgi:hypothetical protein
MSDFEVGLTEAIKKVWPEIEVDHCMFHYSQIIRKNLFLIVDLRKAIKSNLKYQRVMKMFMALAYLPVEYIKKGVDVIIQYQIDNNLLNDFDEFNKYFLKNWINSKNRQKFSVYGLNQPWPTQIGSRATFLKNRHFEGQNLDVF